MRAIPAIFPGLLGQLHPQAQAILPTRIQGQRVQLICRRREVAVLAVAFIPSIVARGVIDHEPVVVHQIGQFADAFGLLHCAQPDA